MQSDGDHATANVGFLASEIKGFWLFSCVLLQNGIAFCYYWATLGNKFGELNKHLNSQAAYGRITVSWFLENS